MKLSKMILLILGSSLVWGCSLDERRVGASLGSGDEPQQMLTTEDAENLESTNRNIEIISSVDLTGYAENGSEEIIQLRNGRVIFQWYEDARSDYFAFIQDAPSGDTIRVLFEGATKKGIAEVSFNIRALAPGSYRWLLTRKVELDTVQQVEFNLRQ